jgi:hypothetical protein
MSHPLYNGGPTLAERFRKLMREDGMLPSEAVERLGELFYAFHFHILPPLPADTTLLFTLGPADELVAKLTDGRQLDPEKILTREPHMLEAVPVPLATYRMMTTDYRQEEQDALAEVLIDVPANGETQLQPEAAPAPPVSTPPEEGAAPVPPPSTDGRERPEWEAFLVPLLITMHDEHQLPNKNAAFRAVERCLIGRGLTMSRGAIYDGLKRHCSGWWSD